MIALIKDNFLEKDDCKKLINFYKENKKNHLLFRDTIYLNLNPKKDLGKDLFNNIHSISKLINNSIIDWAQIVFWSKGSFQNLHFDNASKITTLSSICYLNDDFKGGQTYFEDNTIFSPKIGRILFFDGKHYHHGVKKITKGERYTLAIWYKKLRNDK
jgi:predicted 2-oxoglutarate/Fe(II)-dependent dioxygenase YbiX